MLGIVIPAYNRPNSLREALWSLVSQTNKKFFTIVVDDASSESLEPICNEFNNLLHIKYIKQEKNGGPGVARQTGLELCYKLNFDLVMFLDSDDKLYPHTVARLTHEINHGLRDLVSSQIWAEDNYGTGSLVEANNKTWLHGKIFRTNYLKQNNIRFPAMRDNEDLAFNLMAIEGTSKKSTLNEPLYLFRYEKSSLTRRDNMSLKLISYNYLEAIGRAAEYLDKKNINSKTIIIDTIACYNFYQMGKVLLGEPDNSTKNWAKFLLTRPEMKQILADDKQMEKFIHLIRSGAYFNKKLYWFEQTFSNWVEEMTCK